MNRRQLVFLLLAAPVAVRAQSFNDIVNTVKDPLIGMLTSKLGISDNQAKGGMGSVLTLAEEKMPSANFSKLSSLIPGAQSYIDSAKQLGAVVGPLKNMGGLDGALARLGMKPETVKQFVPTVANYVGKMGGDGTRNMLLAALK